MCQISYKGFKGKYSLDDINKVLLGKVLGIEDPIYFHGDSITEVENDFRKKIDIYLDVVWSTKANDKYLDGRIHLNIPAKTHRLFHIIAKSRGMVANQMIKEFIDNTVNEFSK